MTNTTTNTTSTNTSKPVFECWFLYSDGLGDHELWAMYDSEEDMRRDCADAIALNYDIALNYEGAETEENELYISVTHNYFEII